MQTVNVITTRAFFSKNHGARADHVYEIRALSVGLVIHLHPKNSSPYLVEGVSSFTYEDIEETWLQIAALAGSASTLILEKASRYPRVAGTKFKKIQTLAKRVGHVFIVDIVPFTLEPRFLYTTFSYLGTDILGISKYAAMHEEYEELQADGRVVRVGSDPAELARRIAPVSAIDYNRFTAERDIVTVRCSFDELERYEAAKEELFSGSDEPAKIVTKLADLAHAFPSRGDALLNLMRTIEEPAVIYVNLSSYAARINRAARAAGLTRHKAVSYQIGCEDPIGCAVYMEAPIVNSHFFLDAESRILPGGRAVHIRSDAKVDTYLFGKLQAELAAIDTMAGELSSMRSEVTLDEYLDELEEGQETGGRKLFIGMDVLEAARRRVAWAFDNHERVVVSVSGGKDSTVMFELAHAEAVRRGRSIYLFFLDQEAEYQASIDIVTGMMARPDVIPMWFQIPLRMTNATSYTDEFFHAWEPGREDVWMRPQVPIAIRDAPGAPDRFYPFIDWVQGEFGEGTVFLVGLRADEAFNRYRAVTRNPAVPGVTWTSKGNKGSVQCYPIYDWSFEDVWVFMARFNVPYNRVYDRQYSKQFGINEMRVSFLLHEHSFNSMTTLQEFEHDTYERLVNRISGAHLAAIYASEKQILSAEKLPAAFSSWLEYRNFLLGEVPQHRRHRFEERFASQKDVDRVHRQQVRQLLLNDYENNVPVINTPDPVCTRRKWMELL